MRWSKIYFTNFRFNTVKVYFFLIFRFFRSIL
nr:MAG TPA: hypothetical protein [Caudoviricetes sp.]